MRLIIPLFALIAATACTPDETRYLDPDGIYWSTEAGTASATTEIVITGVPGAALAGSVLFATNETTGAVGSSANVGVDGSFVATVTGQLADDVLLSYATIDAVLTPMAVDPDPIKLNLHSDAVLSAPAGCGGCGPMLMPDETGYAVPIEGNLSTWNPPYVLYNRTANTADLFRQGDDGLFGETGDDLCFFSVEGPGPGLSGIACETLP